MSEKVSTLVIGAGLTGMSCAAKLGKDAVILEKTERPGGLCKTDIIDGFILDHVIHLIHWRNEDVRSYIEGLLKDNRTYFQREAYIYTHGKMGKYPIQVYVDAFPKDVQLKCFEGLIKAHLSKETKKKQNYKDWLLAKFGEGLCELFFFPFNEKQWGRPLDEIVPAGTTKYTPKASLSEFIRGTFFHEDVVVGYNPRFFYPLRGGIESLSQKMAVEAEKIYYNEEVSQISLKKRILETRSGRKISFDFLVSTMPLPKLIQAIQDAPKKIKSAAGELKNISEYSLNFGIKGKPPPGQWTYFPEKKFTFSRISVGSRFSPHMAPEGCYSLWVETFFNPEKKPDFDALKEKVIKELIEIGFVKSKTDILACQPVHMPFAYVVYDFAYEKNIRIILNYLKKHKVKIAGRFGEWKYTSIEESILDGWRIAQEVREGK
ncbi:MAG: FAD-dependent oxidoreductase [Candidatus Diapherotrites archaeon]